MNIFNETLEVNKIKCTDSKKMDIYVNILAIFMLIIILLDIIIKNEQLTLTLFCMWIFFLMFILYKDINKSNNNKTTINPSNPLSKLYPINKQVCLVLISLWKIYNITQNQNHSVSLDKEKIKMKGDIGMEKLYLEESTIGGLLALQYQLMSMLTGQDKQTLNLLNLEDIDSYTKLYMLIIAPVEVKHLQSKIQDLHQKFTDNKSFYLLEQLEKTAKEIDEKSLNENYYFDYKEWYNNIEDWLKNINDEKYLDEAAKQNYKQMIKDINK